MVFKIILPNKMESISAAIVDKFSFVDCGSVLKIEVPEDVSAENINESSAKKTALLEDSIEQTVQPSQVVYVKMEPCKSEDEQKDISKCMTKSVTDLKNTEPEESTIKSELRCKECNFLIATEEKLLEEQQRYYRHCGRKHYVCKVCFNAYSNKTYLTKHHERHHLKVRPYVCELCNKEFSSVIDVSRHKNNIHLKLKPHECSICQKTFALRPNLLTHKKTVHFKIKSFICDTCKKSFSRKSKLTIHISQMHKAFSCDLCSKTYDQKDELSNHLSVVHSGVGEFTCFACNKGFSKKNSLVVHQRFVHLRYKPHSCELCGKSFNIKSHLGDHMAVHLNERFTCEVCPKSFSQCRTLKRHMKFNHPSPVGPKAVDSKVSQETRSAESLSTPRLNLSPEIAVSDDA